MFIINVFFHACDSMKRNVRNNTFPCLCLIVVKECLQTWVAQYTHHVLNINLFNRVIEYKKRPKQLSCNNEKPKTIMQLFQPHFPNGFMFGNNLFINTLCDLWFIHSVG
jgi:hypothetical protein